MGKYIFAGLDIELTRRCNMRCKHCGRGEAQNVTITRDIIDRIFDNVQDCVHLYISGGEPMLELDILLYLLDKARSWERLAFISMNTNGSVLDERVVHAFEELCKAPIHSDLVDRNITRTAKIMISNDEYHTEGTMQKALDYYSPLFAEANKRLGGAEPKLRLETWSPVNKEEAKDKRDLPAAVLIYAGRAKDIVNESMQKDMLIKVPPYNNHRLKITGDIVHCITKITAKGDVVVAAEDDSYDSYDASAVGNIMYKSLDDIIDEHQNRCVLSCNESNYINQINYKNMMKKYLSYLGDVKQSNTVSIKEKLLYEINSATFKLREMLKKTYSIIPAQDLLGELPMVLDDNNLNVLVMRIIGNTHWSVKKRLEEKVSELESEYASLINSSTTQAVRSYCEAIAYMQDNGLSLIVKLRKEEMQRLHEKIRAYSEGELEPNNDGVFACGESGIFANEKDIGEEYSKERKMSEFYRAINEYSKMR